MWVILIILFTATNLAVLLLISFLILVFHYFLSLAKESWILLLISKNQLLASATLSFLCFSYIFWLLWHWQIFPFSYSKQSLCILVFTWTLRTVWASVAYHVEQNQTWVSDSVSCYLNGKQSHYQTKACLFKAQYIWRTVFLKEYIY